jgi:hypothetical protein
MVRIHLPPAGSPVRTRLVTPFGPHSMHRRRCRSQRGNRVSSRGSMPLFDRGNRPERTPARRLDSARRGQITMNTDKTNAMRVLDRLVIEYEFREYTADPRFFSGNGGGKY